MTFNISEFVSNGLVHGGARPSLFDVTIFTPFGSPTESRASMLVHASELPSSPIQQVPAYYFGRAIKLAGNRDFDDWEVEVLNDEDFALRIMFENWSNKINALVSNRQSDDSISNGYKSNGLVRQYKQDKTVAREYELVGIWPRQISPIRLDWERGNAIETYSVRFSMDWWIPASTGSNSSSDDYSGTLASDGVSG